MWKGRLYFFKISFRKILARSLAGFQILAVTVPPSFIILQLQYSFNPVTPLLLHTITMSFICNFALLCHTDSFDVVRHSLLPMRHQCLQPRHPYLRCDMHYIIVCCILHRNSFPPRGSVRLTHQSSANMAVTSRRARATAGVDVRRKHVVKGWKDREWGCQVWGERARPARNNLTEFNAASKSCPRLLSSSLAPTIPPSIDSKNSSACES